MQQYKVVTPPATEPCSLAELRQHMRVFVQDDNEDAYIASLGKTARELLEAKVCRSLVTQTLDAKLDGFPTTDDRAPQTIKLLYPPLQSISSINYIDPDGVEQTLSPSTYAVAEGTPGLVARLANSWPSTSDRPGSVTVRFVAGYGDADDVPEVAKLCVKIMAAHWYDRREPIVTGTIVATLPFMLDSLAASLFWGSYP